MPIESLQLLTPWAFNTHNITIPNPNSPTGGTYGVKGFANHPCSKWLYESPANVWWVVLHGMALCGAYGMRYSKNHGSYQGLSAILDLVTSRHSDLTWRDHTSFVQAMPEKYKVVDDAVTAYRNYILFEKGYAEWNHSQPPTWWDSTLHENVRKQYLMEKEQKRLERRNAKHSRVSSTV